MFTTILIANRGEIACRIMRTCRGLGIRTIAVYSDADANARHVRSADCAVRIGPAPARASYLDAQAIVSAALAERAEAIHPGYGFLSEQLELIDACAAAGLVFIGPHREAVRRMGSKIESKRVAAAAGIACVPGYHGDDQSNTTLLAAAQNLGYPLLIKASAGGGGKGLKRVSTHEDFAQQLALARAEARAAFGDERVLLERYIERPRHLEVQLLGDRHGGLVHLFERECSIQRNFQKLIEEAPANHLSDSTRARLCEAALALGRAIDYNSVGTVEFVLDADHNDEPYFLEMNTRLQVEHPVTELTAGFDLVEQQIKSAYGLALPFAQADIKTHGWAIEARINAEVPAQDYRASFGSITDYGEPTIAGVRIDSGIDALSAVTPHYDSMLAKVIAYGGNRAVARTRLQEGVRALYIAGVETNQAFLDALIGLPAFNDVLTTRFLTEAFPAGWQADLTCANERIGAAAAAWYFAEVAAHATDRPLDTLIGFRLTAAAGRPAMYTVQVSNSAQQHDVMLFDFKCDQVSCCINAVTYIFCAGADDCSINVGPRCYRIDRRNADIRCVDASDSIGLWGEGHWDQWTVRPAVLAQAAVSTSANEANEVLASLPGIVTQVLAHPGAVVAAGATLVMLEAMKLVHALCAPRDGVVATINVAVGDTIQGGTVVVTLLAKEE